MIKIIGLLCVFLGVTSMANAQLEGQFRAQYANEVALGTGFLGQNFTGEFFPVDKISIAPSVTFFLPATGQATGFDLSGRYYFTEDRFQVYGLAGYGYYVRNFEFNPLGRLSFNSINLGAGGIYKFNDELGINPEIRFQTQRNEFLIKLGIVYFIN